MRPGSREWHERFERDRARFDRVWPWWVSLCVLAAVTGIALVATGVLPVWVLFI